MIDSNGHGELDLFSDILKPADEIQIEVPGANGSRFFVFDAMDTATYRNYNDTIVGRGRKRGDAWKAGRVLFEKKCKRVDGLTENEEKQLAAANKTAVSVMLSDKRYVPLIDQLVGKYIQIVVPDAIDSKSNGDSD